MDYEDWYAAVDALCAEYLGLGIDDLPDWESRSYFDDEMTPEEALAARFDLDELDDLTPEHAMGYL